MTNTLARNVRVTPGAQEYYGDTYAVVINYYLAYLWCGDVVIEIPWMN